MIILGCCTQCNDGIEKRLVSRKSGLCPYHYIVSKPKKVYIIKTKKTKINRVSKKRQKQEQEYSRKRKEYMLSHPICEVRECQHNSEELHHKKGRIGELLTDERFFMAVCTIHHKIIEGNPGWAKEQKYSLSRLSK